MGRTNTSSPSLKLRLRRALGRLRRSPAVVHATGFAGRQTLRARQQWHRRFVRGVWVHTTDYLAHDSAGGRILHTAFPAGRFRIAPPTYAPEPPAERVGNPLGARFRARTTVCLRSPWVLGTDGAVVAADRQLLWDLSYDWPGRPHQHSVYALPAPHALALPGTTLTLAAMGAGGNYFHFLCNSVARLAYLPPDALALVDQIVVSGEVTPFVREALALFGLAPERLIGMAAHPALRPECLLVPSLIEHPFVIPAHVCEFLRRRVFTSSSRRGVPRRIFIDRSDAATRRILNLAALAPVFAEFGIEVVRLAGRSLLSQARLFREAELVIANHGAALSNLVFCEEGTRVLQILAPGMTEREYRTISQHRRLAHDYVAAGFASRDDARLPRKDRDLVLDPVCLRRILAAEFTTASARRLSA